MDKLDNDKLDNIDKKSVEFKKTDKSESKSDIFQADKDNALAAEKNSLIKEVASKRNIEFIDFNYERELNLNWENDTQDNGYHLNIYGAEKLGKCLSKYIDNKFKLKNHREEKEYASWEEFLKIYNDAKSKNEVKI